MTNLLFVIMCIIYGTTFLAIKLGLNAGLAPFLGAALRFVIAGLILLVFIALRGRLRLAKTPSIWREMFIIGSLTTGACFAAVYWAENFLSSGIVALLSAFSPIMIALMYSTAEESYKTPDKLLGFALGGLGVGVVMWPAINFADLQQTLLPLFVLFLGEAAYAIGSVRSARIIKRGDVDVFELNGWQCLFGGLILLVLSVAFEWNQWAWEPIQAAWLSLAFLTIFGSVVAASLYFYLMKAVSPVFASLWLYISPVIAVIVGHLVLNEPIGPHTWIGAAMILIGVAMAKTKPRLRVQETLQPAHECA